MKIFICISKQVWEAHGPAVRRLVDRYWRRTGEDRDEEEEELGCFDSNLVTASVALVLLWLFLSFGAWMFTLNEDWTFLDSFYFCFITMTTIGPAISHTNEVISVGPHTRFRGPGSGAGG